MKLFIDLELPETSLLILTKKNMSELNLEKIKAFLFDMDGVLINSEKAWKKYEHEFLINLIGQKAYQIVKNDLIGTSIKETFRISNLYGNKISWEEFTQKYDQTATKVYQEAELTDDIEKLLKFLKSKD